MRDRVAVQSRPKAQALKVSFHLQASEFLGHLITPNGIYPNPDCVRAVKNFPVPQSVREVRVFLGIAYYRRFIEGFTKIALPLHSLTQKGVQFEWSPSCQSAFGELKTRLIQAPVLAYPDFNKNFTLETHASVKGLGAVLPQQQDNPPCGMCKSCPSCLHKKNVILSQSWEW